MKELCDAYDIRFIVSQITGIEERDDRMSGVKVTGGDGVTRVVPMDMLLVFFGLPQLGPIAEWGLRNIERKQIVVDTEKFETSVPGIFAVGDVNTYPGKKKLDPVGLPRGGAGGLGAAPTSSRRSASTCSTPPPARSCKVLGVETPNFD